MGVRERRASIIYKKIKNNFFIFILPNTAAVSFFSFVSSCFFFLFFVRYVIDENGKIGYKGELGPDGYKPEECRAWLEENMGKK